jgi:hypothetical protein
MAIYPPPTFLEEIPIFNTINWENSGHDTIDIAYLNANYLRFPVAQGFETLQEISVNGNANFNNPVFVNDNITLEQGVIPPRSITFSDGTVQTTAAAALTPLVPPPTGVYTSPSSITVNQYGQTTAITSGTVGGSPNPFFSSSGVLPVSTQSIAGGGFLNLQPQILFDAVALTDFDDNTAITIQFNTSVAFGGASGYYQVGSQISGKVDFYPKRAVYNVLNENGIYNIYQTNNGSTTLSSGYEFGNADRKCWAYDINEISGTPEMAGANIYLQINKGITGQVIVGIFITGQTYPYSAGASADAVIRFTHSVELINQGKLNPAFPVKLTIPYLPPPPATAVVWENTTTNFYTAVNGKLVYGGFGLGIYTP